MKILKFGTKIIEYSSKGIGLDWVPTPPTPIVPPNTLRVRTNDGNPPSKHQYAFRNCGINTVTGAAELAQISGSWK